MRKMMALLLVAVFTAVMVAPLLAAEPIKPVAKPIDVNTASAVELQKLKMVGPVLSQRIVEERTAKGPFASLQDLTTRVKGIGPDTIAGWGTTAVCNPPAPVQVK